MTVILTDAKEDASKPPPSTGTRRSTKPVMCPHCDAIYENIPISHRGKLANCKACAQQFVIKFIVEAESIERPFDGVQLYKLKRHPLWEWGAYSVLMMLLLLLVCGDYFFQALVSDSSGMCIVILLLFGVGFAKSLWDTHVLQTERTSLNEQVEDLGTASSLREFLNEHEDGLFRDHLHAMVKISAHEPDFHQDSLISLLHSKLHARSTVSEMLSGVLVSLGLIGTVAGLIKSTSGLSSVMQAIGSAEDDAMASGLRETLGGMGLAFYTTLLGAILGSVVLKVITSVYSSNVDTFSSHLAEVCEVYVVPRLRRIRREEA